MLEKILKRCGSRGQVLVFTAFMLPVMFMFFGATFEFGWWYLNQSRLQNAADAAVIAGAHELIKKDERLKEHKAVDFISENDDDFQKFIKDKEISVEMPNTLGLSTAEDYKKLNMRDLGSVTVNNVEDFLYADKKITYQDAYYAVSLSGSVEHLFDITKKFGAMPLKSVAVAKLTQGVDLLGKVQVLKQNDVSAKVIYDWERDKKNRDTTNNYHAQKRTVRATNRSVNYVDGDIYRTETIFLNGTGESGDSMEVTGDAHVRTNMNKIQMVGDSKQYLVDDLFVDFRGDLSYSSFTDNWDIGNGALSGLQYAYQNRTSPLVSKSPEIKEEYKPEFDLRILATINLDKPYEVRDRFDSNGNEIKDSQGNSILPSDPLYVRIESEPIYHKDDKIGASTVSTHSSVRQIIININASNTEKDSDGNYKYRPLVIFYDGPEGVKFDNRRESKPVIINFNADFRGIIVMENSPMVINGNGHNFEGFIIAKEFLNVKTDSDFYDYTTVQISGKDFLVKDEDLIKKDALVSKAQSANKTVFVNGDKLVTIPNSKLKNTKNAEDYNTTDYVRPIKKLDGNKTSDPGQEVYVLNTATWKETATKDWYDFTTKADYPDGKVYCVYGVDKDILLYSRGWRVVTDSDGNQKIVEKFEQNIDATYVKVSWNGETFYISSESKYYTKYDMNAGQRHVNSVYVDNKGEIAYKTDSNGKYIAINPSRKNPNERWIFTEKDKQIFDYTNDFNLNSSNYDTFGGVVPVRHVYIYLNDGSDDNIFTTDRAREIT